MYNRWLATLGGGEKLGLTVAEYLSKKHPVTVISHKPVDKDLAASRLSLDLSNVNFEFIPERLAPEITPITADYDLFINASFLDFFPSLAPISVYLVYFPTPVEYEPVMKHRRVLKSILRKIMLIPEFTSGVVSIEAGPISQYRGVELPLKAQLPNLGRDYVIQFDIALNQSTKSQLVVLIDGETVKRVTLPGDKSFVHTELTVPGISSEGNHELIIDEENGLVNFARGFPDITMMNFIIRHPRYRLYQLFFERFFRGYGLRLYNLSPGVFSILKSVDTYDAIWGISQFSRYWIEQYWKRSCEILTPPVNVEEFQPLKKKNQILNVGRFFAGSHNKKHLVMVKAFKELVDAGLVGWELILAGGTTPGLEHEVYLQKVYSESKGYPIEIHPDIAFKDLVNLYGQSAIYWHASGFGEDEYKEPIKFEHFGITTVEAMAAGCVPVVIGKGGQPEIVKHGKTGFLWLSIDELKNYTLTLINDPEIRGKYSSAAESESRCYDKEHFYSNLHELLLKVGID